MTATIIRTELVGSDTASAGAISITARTPILSMCRTLLANGFAPATRLEAWRGDTLCLVIRSIRAGAALTVSEAGTRFAPWKPFLPFEAPPRIAAKRRRAS